MKSLLNFIIKYLYTFVFIFFEIVCFALIFTANNYHRVSFLNSSNYIVGTISEQWSEVTVYFKLKIINDSILNENERLINQIEKYRKDNIPAIENSGFEYIAANVVGAKVNSIKNFISINKGEKHGIQQDMGVIGPNGIVGIVYSSSNNFSSVIPLVNTDIKISVKFEKNDYFGSLSWDGKDINTAILLEIPGYVKVQIGDEIVTSGFSSVFPEGMLVGTVKSFTKDQSTDFYKILVDLYTDFNNINYVYVIKNRNYQEQQDVLLETEENND
jgi:rod shape-determining protein MreC